MITHSAKAGGKGSGGGGGKKYRGFHKIVGLGTLCQL